MTTTTTVICDGCQASYQVPKERAGARFKCKKCAATLTVPGGAAPPRVEETVAPVAPPRHATPAASVPKRPVRPDRPERPARGAEQAAAAPKSKLNLIVLLVLGIAVLAVGGYFAWPKDAPGQGPKTTDVTANLTAPGGAPAGQFDAAKRIEALKADTGTLSAGMNWALAKKLEAEAKSWQEKKAPEDAVNGLLHAHELAIEDVIRQDPDHAEARAWRGEVKYKNDLDPFFDAQYLSESDRELVRKNRLSVTTMAGGNGGWVPKKVYDAQVAPLVDRLAVMQAAAESLAASPFGRAAKILEDETLKYLSNQLEGKTAFRAFVHKPYVIFVEENPGWSPSGEAKTLFSPLKATLEAFMTEFASLGLEPLDVPVPVLYFVSENRYQEYNKSIGHDSKNVLAHYETQSGRLVLNRGVDHETIIHEGTHQIFDKYTKNKRSHQLQSAWFQEGVAEWFGGSNRHPGKDGAWAYETGVLLEGRLGEWRGGEGQEFKLTDLLQQTYAKFFEYRMKGETTKVGLIYAQGWFLIYFMNHFNVDANGVVKIGAKGKYKDLWNEYLKAELNGKTGKKVFMEALKLPDEAALEAMHKEYVDYFNFVMKKVSIKQVKSKKLVPWDQYVNPKGVKTGEKDDDLLIAPPRK